VVVETDGTDGYVASMTFPAASITAMAHVPEPSTIVGLLTLGLGVIFVWRRQRK
jgi:hypothetical protein